MTRQTIGAFLATLRKAHGYTQEEVADKIGISNRTLSKWETDRAMPDILYLPALADIYGVSVDEILRGERLRQDTAAPPLSAEEQSKKDEQARQAKRALQRRALAKFRGTMCVSYGLAILAAAMLLLTLFLFVATNSLSLISLITGGLAYIAAFVLAVALRVRASTEAEEGEERRLIAVEHTFCNALRLCLLLPLAAAYAFFTILLIPGSSGFIPVTGGCLLFCLAAALWLTTWAEQRRIAALADDGMLQAALHNRRLARIFLFASAGAIAACTIVSTLLFALNLIYTAAAWVSIACAVLEVICFAVPFILWPILRKKQRFTF